jgi:hypothetical protein
MTQIYVCKACGYREEVENLMTQCPRCAPMKPRMPVVRFKSPTEPPQTTWTGTINDAALVEMPVQAPTLAMLEAVPAHELEAWGRALEMRKLTPEEIADRERGYIGPMPEELRTVPGRASSKPQKRTLVVCIDIDGMHDHGVETLRAKLETLLENMSVNHSMKER